MYLLLLFLPAAIQSCSFSAKSGWGSTYKQYEYQPETIIIVPNIQQLFTFGGCTPAKCQVMTPGCESLAQPGFFEIGAAPDFQIGLKP